MKTNSDIGSPAFQNTAPILLVPVAFYDLIRLIASSTSSVLTGGSAPNYNSPYESKGNDTKDKAGVTPLFVSQPNQMK